MNTATFSFPPFKDDPGQRFVLFFLSFLPKNMSDLVISDRVSRIEG